MHHLGMRDIGGYVTLTSTESSKVVEYETYACCHCEAHFKREVGKGPKAFCLMCHAPTCARKECDPCIPFEAKLEAMEGKRRFWKQLEII